MSDVRTARIAHHPASHVYVDHLAHLGQPNDGASIWDVGALVASGVSIVHLHFGFELRSASDLSRWLDQLAAAGIGLVHTVHDLENPHLVDQLSYDVLVGLLVARADTVITLTEWAAAEVEQRHGRRPIVIAHPHVVPLIELERRARHADSPGVRRGIYVHAGTCRPNLDVGLLAGVATAARPWGGLHIHLRRPLTDRAQLVGACCDRSSDTHVEVRDRLADGDLWDRLATATAVLLPYRWGTHSGLLEAARDLGTPVLAPAIGGYLDQGAALLDRRDVAGSVRRALASPPHVTLEDRRLQRDELVAAHRHIYDALLTGEPVEIGV